MNSSRQIEAHPKNTQNKKMMAGLFSFGGRKNSKEKGAAARRHQRYDCNCSAKISIINSSLILDGVISEIAKGGIKFRPFKTYLLVRNNTEVSIDIFGDVFSGKIVASRNDGYGIALFDQLSDRQVDLFLRHQIK